MVWFTVWSIFIKLANYFHAHTLWHGSLYERYLEFCWFEGSTRGSIQLVDQLMSMVFHCIRVIFEMQSVFDMLAFASSADTECIWGTSFTVEHAFTYSHGGYPTFRHNEIRNLTAQLMSEVCPNASTEPTLQPVTNKRLFHRSECGAHLDV